MDQDFSDFATVLTSTEVDAALHTQAVKQLSARQWISTQRTTRVRAAGEEQRALQKARVSKHSAVLLRAAAR